MSTTEIEHTDSVEDQDPNNSKNGSKKSKSRRPANTAFRQQRLKAWQPILTPMSVLPIFFAVGIVFAPLGGLLLWASAMVEEIQIDYSNCGVQAPNGTFAPIPDNLVSSSFKSKNSTGNPAMWMRNMTRINMVPSGIPVDTVVCTLQFDIPNDIGPPVLFYYRLTNFYQNHRRYVKSEDTDQLMGQARDAKAINKSNCSPLTSQPGTGKPYYPCGLIANSLFNDTFFSPVLTNVAGSSKSNQTYEMTQNGIAWASDKELYKPSAYDPTTVAPPPNWYLKWGDSYNATTGLPDLQNDEPFQVWMRTAGLPTFSKLTLRNDTAPMQAGTYQAQIYDYFPVTIYGGTKSMLISTRTIMGGKNPFLGIAYIVVGGLCILLGALFTVTHLLKPRKLGDHSYLSWNNDQPSTATTTGRAPRVGEAA